MALTLVIIAVVAASLVIASGVWVAFGLVAALAKPKPDQHADRADGRGVGS